jgi:lipopolysaccharide/colanic/teichoic acid biosynthesis glycosyltransferase
MVILKKISSSSRLLTSRRVKRTIDVVFAVWISILVLPIIGCAAVAIKMIDPGPVFFVQERCGLKGRVMKLVKLRTMRRDADSFIANYLLENPETPDPRVYRSANDPRILPKIGSLLRRYSIDELPQIWNVLKGDLSFVGPRPLPDYHNKLLDADFVRIRSSMRPGITGLWQIESRGNASPESIEHYDYSYLRNWSLVLDFQILCRTLVVILQGSGV